MGTAGPHSFSLLRCPAAWRRLRDPVGSNAGRADPNSAGVAVDERPHPLQVWIPAPVRFVVSVAYMMTKPRSLATDLAPSGHGDSVG